MKNILYSTTIAHNPGDEIIHMGVRNIVTDALETRELNWVPYNRNPDLQEAPLRAPRKSLLGNYDNTLLGKYDLAVVSGSPEFCGAPLQDFYQKVLDDDLPLLIIGVGTTFKSQPFTELDKKVFARSKTKIFTRSEHCADLINKATFSMKAKAMVCPALFASRMRALGGEGLCQIVQAPGRGWHEVNPGFLEGLDKDAGVVAFHVKEFVTFQKHYKTTYCVDSRACVNVLNHYDKVVSTRLHGAVLGLSLGIPSIVVGRGDFRIESAAKAFGEFLPVAGTFSEASTISLNEPNRLNTWRFEQQYDYTRAVKLALGEIF